MGERQGISTLHCTLCIFFIINLAFMINVFLHLPTPVSIESSRNVSMKSPAPLFGSREDDLTKPHQRRNREKNVFVIVICYGKTNETAVDKPLQLEQSIVLIKSAVTMTTENLRFVVLSDSEELFTELERNLSMILRDEDKRKLSLEHRAMEYPIGRKGLRNFFKPCATARLFLPLLLTFDSVVYLDTDAMFMRPPEELWEVFEKFTTDQVIGITETRGFYNNYIDKFPWYGDTGLNSGVILMNLSRIDRFPGGWIDQHYLAFDQYKDVLHAGDQDLLNIVFNDKPHLVRDIGCEWNFCGSFCELDRLTCHRAEKYGVSLLHGNYGTLYSGYLQVIYNSWKSYEMGSSLSNLWRKMDKDMSEVNPASCLGLKNLNEIITKWGRYNIHNYRQLKT